MQYINCCKTIIKNIKQDFRKGIIIKILPNSLTVDSVNEGVPSVQVGVAVRPVHKNP